MASMRKGSRVAGGSRRGRPGRAAIGRLGRPSLAMLLLIAGLLLASAFVAIEIQRNGLARQAADLRRDIAAQQAAYADLSGQVAAKKTDDYVVNKARDYGYVLPGEALIGVEQAPAAAVVELKREGPSRVQKWITLFFGAR